MPPVPVGHGAADGTPLADELGAFVSEQYIDRQSDLVAAVEEVG